MSGKEKEIILAIDKDGVRTGDICRVIGMKASAFSKYRSALIHKGILDGLDYGYNTLVLPRLNEIARIYALDASREV